MIYSLDEFDEIVVADSEFVAHPGEVQQPICIAFRELRSGRREVHFECDLRRRGSPPFSTGPRVLLVAHYASAEVATMLALGWDLPHHVIDTFAEFRVLTNGDPQHRASLLAAAAFFSIPTMADTAKAAMRDLAVRGEHTEAERRELGEYCLKDVDATVELFRALESRGIDVPRALVRGQFMVAAARMERVGLPVDRALAQQIAADKEHIQRTIIAELDTIGLFDETHLRQERVARFARGKGLPWPRTESGRYSTDRETFEEMSLLEPSLRPTLDSLDLLSALRQVDLPIGTDGRTRTILSPFSTKTGRGAPAARGFLLAQAAWRRGLIRPPPGRVLAYLDFSQQEFGIAAALSGDAAMWEDYLAGDAYIALAVRTGHAPVGATKKSHPAVRETFKTLVLGLQYSMSAYGLALRLGVGIGTAELYVAMHHAAYARFWAWNDALVFRATEAGGMRTSFGWAFRPGSTTSPRTIRNWPMQAHGGDILRIACILGWERGVTICAPLHDAVLIEADERDVAAVIKRMEGAMIDASVAVIGRPLGVSHEIITRETAWVSPKARPMWDRVMNILRTGKAE